LRLKVVELGERVTGAMLVRRETTKPQTIERAVVPATCSGLAAPSDLPFVKLSSNSPLGHEQAFHGLNPQESARNYGHGTPGAVREAAANDVPEYTYKYL
jgi:hypothetical protein